MPVLKKDLTRSRIVSVVLLAWIAVIGFDFFLHGGLLSGFYTVSDSFLLPPEQAFRLIPLGYLSFLLIQIFLVWLMIRLNISGWKPGFYFGLKVGAFVWGALCLGLLSISTASVELMAGWFLGQTVEAGLGGLVAGAGFSTEKPGRLTGFVILFFILIVVLTIVLQSTGIVPTPHLLES